MEFIRKIIERRPPQERQLGQKIDLHNQPFTIATVDRANLRDFGFIVFEHAQPAVGQDPNFHFVRRDQRRQGVQFPHQDEDLIHKPDVIILRARGASTNLPIEDPAHLSQDSNRQYVEPYTLIADADTLWKLFVRYVSTKNKNFLEEILEYFKADIPGTSKENPVVEGKAMKELRTDIRRFGPERVGQVLYDPKYGQYDPDDEEGWAAKPWKEWFLNNYFGQTSFGVSAPHAPGYLPPEEIRVFLM